MQNKSPPRYVPTLTQVIRPGRDRAAAAQGHAPSEQEPLTKPIPPTAIQPDRIQQVRDEWMAQTLMQVDILLQPRIREAVSRLALVHAHRLLEELQPELEAAVAQVLDEAIQHAAAEVFPRHG